MNSNSLHPSTQEFEPVCVAQIQSVTPETVPLVKLLTLTKALSFSSQAMHQGYRIAITRVCICRANQGSPPKITLAHG